jgi:3-hydroxyisobutyrate dehydrogenase-like beta-hydroxyacid dehydrogenase
MGIPAGLKVGIVGIGAMGMGVAKALLAKGFEVVVRDLVAAREEEAVAAGAKRAASPADLAKRVNVVITLVVDAAQTREVLGVGPETGVRLPFRSTESLTANGSLTPIFMMCSTIAPTDTEEIAAALAKRGLAMVDAPISGGPARAHAGTLSMMASGSDAAIERCRPVIEAMSSKCFRMSDRPGDGSRMKIVNNMLAAANLAAGCEAMAMAAKLGLDLEQAADVVSASSGGSWIFADRMPRALAGDYAPRAAARVLLKDVGLFVHAARQLGLSAPMAECAREIFHDTVARGFAEEDDAAVLKRYAQAWRVELPSGKT